MKKLLVLATAVAAVALVAGCHSAAPMTPATNNTSMMPAQTMPAHQDMKGEMPAAQ